METYMQMLGRLAKNASRGAANESKEQRTSRSGK